MTHSPGHLGNPYGRFFTGVGSRADRPLKLLVPITTHSFGDVFIYTSATARIAAAFAHTLTDFVIDTRRPYTRDILAMYPFPARVMTVPDDNWSALPFAALVGPALGLDPERDDYHDIVLTNLFMSSAHFGRTADCPLVIPADRVEGHTRDLLAAGLDPDRWFCVMHWREPTFRYKSVGNPRDADPAKFLPVIQHVIDRHGGQVVLLGHPEMSRPAPRPGLVDLAAIRDSWSLQAFAVSRARFFVGSPSGATGMAHAFLIPSAHVDVLDWYTGEPRDWVVTPTVRLPDGQELRQQALFESGWLHTSSIDAARKHGQRIDIKPCSIEHVIKAVDLVHRDTADVDGWRPLPVVPKVRRNILAIPPDGQAVPRFVPL